jgi:hypothetical protein
MLNYSAKQVDASDVFALFEWHVIRKRMSINQIKLYVTLDNNILSNSADCCAVWFRRHRCRCGRNRENYFLYLPGVLCDLIDLGRLQKILIDKVSSICEIKKVWVRRPHFFYAPESDLLTPSFLIGSFFSNTSFAI